MSERSFARSTPWFRALHACPRPATRGRRARSSGCLIALFDRGLGSCQLEKTGGLVSAAPIEANVRRADNRRHPADFSEASGEFIAICLTCASVNCVFASTFVSFDGKLAFWLIVISPFFLLVGDAFIAFWPAVPPDRKDLRAIFVFRPSPSSRHRGVWTMAPEPIERRGSFRRRQWGSRAPAHQKFFSRDTFSAVLDYAKLRPLPGKRIFLSLRSRHLEPPYK